MFGFYNILRFDYWHAAIGSYIIAGVVAFTMHKFFTFGAKSFSIFMVYGFALSSATSFFVGYSAARSGVHYLLPLDSIVWKDNISFLIGTCIYIIMHYLLMKYIVFRQNQPKEDRVA
jgi:putative flippase GtrA